MSFINSACSLASISSLVTVALQARSPVSCGWMFFCNTALRVAENRPESLQVSSQLIGFSWHCLPQWGLRLTIGTDDDIRLCSLAIFEPDLRPDIGALNLLYLVAKAQHSTKALGLLGKNSLTVDTVNSTTDNVSKKAFNDERPRNFSLLIEPEPMPHSQRLRRQDLAVIPAQLDEF